MMMRLERRESSERRGTWYYLRQCSRCMRYTFIYDDNYMLVCPCGRLKLTYLSPAGINGRWGHVEVVQR